MAFCCMNSGVYGWFRTTMVGALVDGSRSRTEPRLLRRARIAVDVWCRAVVDGSRPRTEPLPLPRRRARVAVDV